MDRTKLRNYAPQARRDFIQAVTDRAAYYGLTTKNIEAIVEKGDVAIIGGKAFPRSIAQKRKALEEQIMRLGFEQTMEAMAYTWFNRLVAIRFMELHGYLDHGYRVLSHPEDKTTPEILEHAEHVDLPGLDRNEVIDLKLDGTKEAELYRMLLMAQCNALHAAMPFLFERIDDETELLLPDNLLHSDSLIRNLVNEIDEEDWREVEIIGWLYQFYISEKKDQVIGKVVKSEDIPAATQLFTPNWIVKYLVQNSLGRQWLATYPNSPLRQQMEYYIEPAEQTSEVQAQLKAITPESLNPEELTLLDPACGSGHILVEAYDLFKAIYQERGYRAKDIPTLILQKNLFGLEIDDRAAQLAAFTLMMKARADDRRIFTNGVQPNVVAIQESKGLNAKALSEALNVPLSQGEKQGEKGNISPADVADLINLFEHGKTFGSLIQVPAELGAKLPAIEQRVREVLAHGDLMMQPAAKVLLPFIRQASLLSRQYDAVVANPPYMGSRYFIPDVKEYLKENYTAGDADLCTAFIIRGLDSSKKGGRLGMITLPNWMFLPTFERLRHALIENYTLESLSHNGRGVFGADFGSCAFVISNLHAPHFRATCCRLFDVESFVISNDELQERFLTRKPFIVDISQFSDIPGRPIAYWIERSLLKAFKEGRPFAEVAPPRQGLATADNDRFLRFWPEVDHAHIGWGITDRSGALQSKKRWFPYSKGGSFRRWYGNNYLVVDWANDGWAIRNFRDESGKPRSRAQNTDFYFCEAITWSLTSVSQLGFAARHRPAGYIFDINGMSAFPNADLYVYLALLNSMVAREALKVINPTFAFQAGDIARIPLLLPENKGQIGAWAEECVQLSKEDWDASEVSWDFSGYPLVRADVRRHTLSDTWNAWKSYCRRKWERLIELEKEINLAFVKAYGLDAKGEQDASDKPVLLFEANCEQDIRSLVSYAIGCMMGRYSLDKAGLIYHEKHERREIYHEIHQIHEKKKREGLSCDSCVSWFALDPDGIVPIMDADWFPDDATNRFVEFISVAWPKEHLEENLTFVADSLGPNRSEQSRDTIRRYLAQSFFKDHLKTYKRRPIYWLFTSGKQRAFQCLVYLHRYNEGTLSRMRTEYVIPLQGKTNARIEHLTNDAQQATSTSHRKKLEKEQDVLRKQQTELLAFDEKLRHYADMRISLDLDDGVKVNYGKFGDLLAEVKVVCGEE